MENKGVFFSLRWKLAILFGAMFFLLQSLSALLSYWHAKDNFEQQRKIIQERQVKIAETLTNDAFMVLEQFAELISDAQASPEANAKSLPLTQLDEYWTRWQLTWGIESIAFYDQKGQLTKAWGNRSTDNANALQSVLAEELPWHQVLCQENCSQQVIIPVLGKDGITGAVSLTRSLSDILIKYHYATNSDIGVLTKEMPGNNTKLANRNQWQHKLLGITNPEKNIALFRRIKQTQSLEKLLHSSQHIEFENAVYEIKSFPIQSNKAAKNQPYFLLVDDITEEISGLNKDLKNIWLYSFLGLLVALLLIVVTLNVSLRRITRLSDALPLLSQNHFDEFRKRISRKGDAQGFDELEKLNLTALSLTDQLEQLEQNIRGQTFDILEKSQELARERDFVNQLIELAPIIVIIQKLNGIIITINHIGVKAFETTGDAVIGKVFDLLLPDSEQEHINKLNMLRNGLDGNEIHIDGELISESGKTQEFSWLHKLLPAKQSGDEAVILSLGVDISERKLAEARNIRMAYYDFLTGLGNRRKFQEEFSQRLAAANRYGYQLGLFFLDLDRFKEINDTGGHEAGDNFLKMVANALKETIRSTDLLCRLGGDEFTLLMPHADLTGVEYIAKKINTVLKAKLFEFGGKSYSASASIGIAIFPLHGSTVSDLMAHADLAMYKAKELGRGQHHLFNPNYDYLKKLSQTVYWRTILENAIDNDQFILAYQPILTIKSNSISHYECLVRLQQADGSLLMPSEFVLQAEELGLIAKIDRIVLKKALKQHCEFNRQGKKFRLSINISKRSFEDPDIFDDFAELLADPEVEPGRIIFEITDSTTASNYQATSALVSKIKALGCILALNDFGVEYPSLNYLKNAPVDYVKIDGSLIRQIDKNEDDKIFVKALIDLAQAYHIKTVAEFVENETVLSILKEFGIDYAQGYHIGKPETIDS